jgi:hypothetical protein
MEIQAIYTALKDHNRVSSLVHSLNLSGFAPRNAEELLVLAHSNSRGPVSLVSSTTPAGVRSGSESVLAMVRREVDPRIVERIESLDGRFPSPPFRQQRVPSVKALLHASPTMPGASVLDSLSNDPLRGSFF